MVVGRLKLGIVPERIKRGLQEQNGRYERMHRPATQDLGPAEDWRGHPSQRGIGMTGWLNQLADFSRTQQSCPPEEHGQAYSNSKIIRTPRWGLEALMMVGR